MTAVATVNQDHLLLKLQELFPKVKIHKNVRNHTEFKYPETGDYMELDFWIPQYDLCFEFQDAYHYIPSWFYHSAQEKVQSRDSLKQKTAHHRMMDLLTIPCWWDGSLACLASTILFQRPDFRSSALGNLDSSPISLNPPDLFFHGLQAVVPGVGSMMLACMASVASMTVMPMSVVPPNESTSTSTSTSPLLNTTVNANANVNVNATVTNALAEHQWWMGEKYDGIRFCWNHDDGVAYTRTGNRLRLLPAIMARLLSTMSVVAVDGEIWFGRGHFAMTSALLHGSNTNWHLVRLIAFDVPSLDCRAKRYEQRYHLLHSAIHQDDPCVRLAPRALCKGGLHLASYLHGIIGRGRGHGRDDNGEDKDEGEGEDKGDSEGDGEGEGVMLRLVGSQYVPGRSPALMKLKASHHEQEGVVIQKGVQEGTSPILLRLVNGRTLLVPSHNVHTCTAPRLGDVVTFSFERHAQSEVPVLPKIIRIRHDIHWGHAVNSHHTHNHHGKALLDSSLRRLRSHLLSLAKRRGMNPQLAATWYSIDRCSVEEQGGKLILQQLNGSYFQVLQQTFPEISFDKYAFYPLRYVHHLENRRRFFENYATQNRFDPLNPQHWYLQSRKRMMDTEGASSVASYHGGCVARALLDLFPDIQLDSTRLGHLRSWSSTGDRRMFFERYAAEHGFDPLSPEHWYSQSRKGVMLTPGCKEVLVYHENSISRALRDLFPDVLFDYSTLTNLTTWRSVQKRRHLFQTYAAQHGFDPFNAESWYQQSREQILATPGILKVLWYHQGSVRRALLDLFPNIKLDNDKLLNMSRWSCEENRREFFLDYARQQAFDPLRADNWYARALHRPSSPSKRIMSFMGARAVMSFHGGKPSRALLELFPDIGLQEAQLVRV